MIRVSVCVPSGHAYSGSLCQATLVPTSPEDVSAIGQSRGSRAPRFRFAGLATPYNLVPQAQLSCNGRHSPRTKVIEVMRADFLG